MLPTCRLIARNRFVGLVPIRLSMFSTGKTTIVSAKDTIKYLPKLQGLGLDNIITVETPDGLSKAMRELSDSTAVGFNTETKPNFERGSVCTGPHLIQLANETNAYLFPIRRQEHMKSHDTDIREFLKFVLESDKIVKVGFGLGNDLKNLKDNLSIEVKGAVDLSTELRPPGKKNLIGFKEGVARILNQQFVIDFNQPKANWQRPIYHYTDGMKLYAGNVAHVPLTVYRSWLVQKEQAAVKAAKRAAAKLAAARALVDRADRGESGQQ